MAFFNHAVFSILCIEVWQNLRRFDIRGKMRRVLIFAAFLLGKSRAGQNKLGSLDGVGMTHYLCGDDSVRRGSGDTVGVRSIDTESRRHVSHLRLKHLHGEIRQCASDTPRFIDSLLHWATQSVLSICTVKDSNVHRTLLGL